MREGISRRELLRRSGAGATAVGVAGLAGCTGSIPFVGDDGASSAIGEWLVDPSLGEWFDESGFEDQHDLEIVETTRELGYDHVVPDVVFDNVDDLGGYGLLSTRSTTIRDRTGIPASEIDWELTQAVEWELDIEEGPVSTEEVTLGIDVIVGEFEPEDIEDNLENWVDDDDEDFSSEGEYGGYDLYEIDDSSTYAFAVGSDSVVQLHSDIRHIPVSDPDELFSRFDALEDLIDGSGDFQRLVEDDEAGDLLEAFDPTDASTGWITEEVDDEEDEDVDDWETGLIGSARGHSIDGETTEISVAYLYGSERNAVTDDLEEHVEQNRDLGAEFATLEEYSVEESDVSDRILSVSGTVQTRAYF